MRKRILLIYLFVTSLVPVSCGRRDSAAEPYLPAVERAVSDTSSAAWHLLAGYEPGGVSGSIAVIGDFAPLCSLVSEFLSSDRFDNIDGREIPDELHDFAGETFAPVFDIANSPYGVSIDEGNVMKLREAAVSMAAASLGSVSYSNTFDSRMTASRIPAKVMVVASPYLCRYAMRDIDTLFAAKGIDIPVLSLSDEMFRRAGERHPDGLVAVIADGKELECGLYRGVYDKMRRSSGGAFPSYIEYADSGRNSKDALNAFLDSYIASGASEKLSAVLLGTSSDSLNIRGLSAALEEIRTSQGLEMENRRSALADDFEFISGEDAVIRRCFRELRSRNLFTHRISYPSVKAYVTVPSADTLFTRTVPMNRLYISDGDYEKVNSLVVPMILSMDGKAVD